MSRCCSKCSAGGRKALSAVFELGAALGSFPFALLRLRMTFLCVVACFALSGVAPAHAGSVYVPLDSWVYPAAERLGVLTGTRQEALGMRPWTRTQVAGFLERAREMDHDDEATELQSSLEREFAPELNAEKETFALESVYTRSTQIAGTPLRDSYHFGQTFANDFGRPYGQGFNNITGASAYAQYRAGLFYVRGEYQHGASLREPDPAAIPILAQRDAVQESQVITQGGPAVDNFRLLDSYVGVSFGQWTGTLGKQSLWWGPAAGGAYAYTNNIEPIWMARLTNDMAYRLPLLGRARLDMFYGKLQGHPFLPDPWIHGEKLSFQPFNNFQIGFARTVVFLGVGRDFSFERLANSYFSVGDQQTSDLPENDPGDRKAQIDFSWKLPWYPATLYMDSFSDDEPSTFNNPSRSSYRPGLYFARLPGRLAKIDLAKMDLRIEGGYTAAVENTPTMFNGFNYWNGVYRDGYTNKKLLIGDTMGRAGVVWQAWTTYWISPRDTVQVSYRHQYISPQFIPGGGTQGDLRGTAHLLFKRNWEVELGVQHERIVIPLLTGSLAPQHNVSGWAAVTYWPDHKVQAQ
jgi:capsule assembly protein Wzi